MLTKNEYIVVSYGKAVIVYTQPSRIDIGDIDISAFDPNITTNLNNRILSKIKSLEGGYGGGCVWSHGLMLINPNDPDQINNNEKYGFEENIRICTSCWDAKFFKLVPNNPNDVLTLMDLFILGFTG